MKIAYIGKFRKMWDEEYIARSFESIGHEVLRVPENAHMTTILEALDEFKPTFVLWAKLQVPYALQLIQQLKKRNIKTVCWVWDLYWSYNREDQIHNNPMFKADLVFTSDGGHDQNWTDAGIKHKCIRQGIYEPECFAEKVTKEFEVVFVGSKNPFNVGREGVLEHLSTDFKFTWFGRRDTDHVRGNNLNKLYAKTKIVVGDSVFSPYYWSNRVVETLGRGGFLIHQEVPGLKEEYPYLVTYKKGDYQDLKTKIEYYLKHHKEREEIIKKNVEWVKAHHLMKHECEKLCQNL